MNPAPALARKAQSAPSSAGSPKRRAGMRAQRFGPRAVERDAALGGGARETRPLTVGLERAGLDRIDRHVVGRMRPRRGGQEGGQAGPGAGRDVEPGDRRAHRPRGDVDDPAEPPLRHSRQKRLNERDRRQHVGFHAGQDVLAGDRAERLERRAAVVVDEDIGVGAGGDQRCARRRIVEIARRPRERRRRSVRGLSLAADSSSSLPRPLRTSSQPASASASAQARPRPLLDAQTIALRPEIPRSNVRLPIARHV